MTKAKPRFPHSTLNTGSGTMHPTFHNPLPSVRRSHSRTGELGHADI